MSNQVDVCWAAGFLFDYFELPLASVQDYYVFTLKSDDELPTGVSRSSFLAAAPAPARARGEAVATAGPAVKKQRTDGGVGSRC